MYRILHAKIWLNLFCFFFSGYNIFYLKLQNMTNLQLIFQLQDTVFASADEITRVEVLRRGAARAGGGWGKKEEERRGRCMWVTCMKMLFEFFF